VSIVTAAELLFGARRVGSSRLERDLSAILSVVPPLAFEEPADSTYADIRSTLEARGTPIGPNDLFIAAHALSLDLTLVTANIREFSRVPDLKVENWLD
jgi:tRNA(fMet)-specific endonuclease VapC